jgi:hypothetical protein
MTLELMFVFFVTRLDKTQHTETCVFFEADIGPETLPQPRLTPCEMQPKETPPTPQSPTNTRGPYLKP